MVPRILWGSISFCGIELNYIHSLKRTRVQLVSKPNYIAFLYIPLNSYLMDSALFVEALCENRWLFPLTAQQNSEVTLEQLALDGC